MRAYRRCVGARDPRGEERCRIAREHEGSGWGQQRSGGVRVAPRAPCVRRARTVRRLASGDARRGDVRRVTRTFRAVRAIRGPSSPSRSHVRSRRPESNRPRSVWRTGPSPRHACLVVAWSATGLRNRRGQRGCVRRPLRPAPRDSTEGAGSEPRALAAHAADHRHRVWIVRERGEVRAHLGPWRVCAERGHTHLDSLSCRDIESISRYVSRRARNVEGPPGFPGAALQRA